MRVTGNLIASETASQLNLLLARQSRLQNQVTSGQRVTAPEDDPVAMGEALSLQNQTSIAGQYGENIGVLQTRATTVANALESLKTIMDRAGEIATQADGTKSQSDLQNFATEVQQLIQQAAQIANSKDGDLYVFAGTASGQAPFKTTTDSNGNVTGVTYQGNINMSATEIGQGSTVTVGGPGANSTGSGARGVFADGRYGADFFGHLLSLESHLQSGDTASISSSDSPDLQKDEANIIYQTASVGVVQSRLDAAATNMDTEKSSLQTALTNVAGADLTSTLVQLSQTQNAYQAALASSSKLLNLQQTLLDYLP